MAHIYIYSPSGAVRNIADFRRAIKRLENNGHAVEIDADALRCHQRFAGDDTTRIAAIHRAAASEADVALITRGGYGLTRILPALKYKKIAKAIAKGTQFIGLSDFTAFQTALLAHSKKYPITWAGNTLVADWGHATDFHESACTCFEDMLNGSSEGSSWYVNKKTVPDADLTILKKPIKNAILWGGNLCVLTSLLGTPYFPKLKRGILFLEDVVEAPYRIERMLSQLLHAGILDQQQAILLGHFTEYKPSSQDKGFNMKTVIHWLRQHTKTPIFTGLPHGHVSTKVLLPIGAPVDFHANTRERLLLWGKTRHNMRTLVTNK